MSLKKKAALALLTSACLSLGAVSSRAAVLFTEDWEGEAVGKEPPYANWTMNNANHTQPTIVSPTENDHEVQFVYSGTNDQTRQLATTNEYDLDGATGFTVQVKMRDTGGNAAPMGFFADSGDGIYRVQIDKGSGGSISFVAPSPRGAIKSMTFTDIKTALNDTSWSISNESTFLLTVQNGDNFTQLDLSINGTPVMSLKDEDAAHISYTSVKIGLFAWKKSTNAFDDIVLSTVPEPASAALGGLLGCGLLLRRRRA